MKRAVGCVFVLLSVTVTLGGGNKDHGDNGLVEGYSKMWPLPSTVAAHGWQACGELLWVLPHKPKAKDPTVWYAYRLQENGPVFKAAIGRFEIPSNNATEVVPQLRQYGSGVAIDDLKANPAFVSIYVTESQRAQFEGACAAIKDVSVYRVVPQ
jgi:hypothetical protein